MNIVRIIDSHEVQFNLFHFINSKQLKNQQNIALGHRDKNNCYDKWPSQRVFVVLYTYNEKKKKIIIL